MIKQISLFSIIAALSLTTVYSSDPIQNNNNVRQQTPVEQQEYQSFALQMNLNDRDADRVFEMGNRVYEIVNGVAKKGDDGKALKIDNKIQYEDGKAPLGRLFHVGPNVKGNDVYLVCEQTTASPHASIAVYSDAYGRAMNQNRVRCMHPALSVVQREMEKLNLCGGPRTCLPLLRVLRPVLIASFLDEQPNDTVWLKDTCTMRQDKPGRTNVYFNFDKEGRLVAKHPQTGVLTEFTAMDLALARAFIVLECDMVDFKGYGMSGDGFLNRMENCLQVCEEGQSLTSKNKVFKRKLLHVTLAKISGVKNTGEFKKTSRENLLFPIANRQGSFAKIQDLFTRTAQFCEHDLGESGTTMVCDKLVVNPASVSTGADHPVLSFRPQDKRIQRQNTNWSENPRHAVNMYEVCRLPGDFVGAVYVNMHGDLLTAQRKSGISEEAFGITHYLTYGKTEGRAYSNLLPVGFNGAEYVRLHGDLVTAQRTSGKSQEEFGRWHYMTYGKKEGRKYQ